MNQIPSTNHDPEILLFESSPFGTLDAIVQHDGKSVYFYLNEAKPESDQIFGTRACWVRNLQNGPLVINEKEMRQGISPMLPKTHCLHRDAQPLPAPERLRVVWLEEGNGAALIEVDPESSQATTLAIIPPWSGLEGFHGYANQCVVESPLCWPMPDNPKLEHRVQRANDFWKSFRSNVDPFAVTRRDLLAAYDAQFLNPATSEPENDSAVRKDFQIEGDSFPPLALVQYQSGNQVILATVGMSLCPQPAVEVFSDNPRLQRRVELAINVTDSPDGAPANRIELLRNKLASLASYPWRNFTWFGAGHTCSFQDIEPGCDSAVLVHDSQLHDSNRPPIKMPSFRDDPINLLWLTPTASPTPGTDSPT